MGSATRFERAHRPSASSRHARITVRRSPRYRSCSRLRSSSWRCVACHACTALSARPCTVCSANTTSQIISFRSTGVLPSRARSGTKAASTASTWRHRSSVSTAWSDASSATRAARVSCRKAAVSVLLGTASATSPSATTNPSTRRALSGSPGHSPSTCLRLAKGRPAPTSYRVSSCTCVPIRRRRSATVSACRARPHVMPAPPPSASSLPRTSPRGSSYSSLPSRRTCVLLSLSCTPASCPVRARATRTCVFTSMCPGTAARASLTLYPL